MSNDLGPTSFHTHAQRAVTVHFASALLIGASCCFATPRKAGQEGRNADTRPTPPQARERSGLVAPVASGVLARLLASLDHATAEMVILARTDPLTSLRNRRAFFDDATALVGGANKRLFLAAMIDVDSFKAVNDTYGHSVGDRVLEHLADNLTRAIRDQAVVGRLGGDEFAVVAPVDSAAAAATLVERLRAACQLGVVIPGLRASLGSVVMSTPCDIDAFLAAADRLLYDAKRANEV